MKPGKEPRQESDPGLDEETRNELGGKEKTRSHRNMVKRHRNGETMKLVASRQPSPVFSAFNPRLKLRASRACAWIQTGQVEAMDSRRGFSHTKVKTPSQPQPDYNHIQSSSIAPTLFPQVFASSFDSTWVRNYSSPETWWCPLHHWICASSSFLATTNPHTFGLSLAFLKWITTADCNWAIYNHWVDGVVGYRICLTCILLKMMGHRRSSVRTWVDSFFLL